MRISVHPVHLLRAINIFTLIVSLADSNNRIRTGNPVSWPGNNLVEGVVRDPTRAKLLLSPSDLPRHRSSINDNYCVVTGAVGDLNSVPVTEKDCYCVNQNLKTIISVKGVSCVNHLSSVQNVTNVPPVIPNLPVGTRLHQFWERWAALGVSPKVLAVLRKGYILPFRFWPNLTRNPTITSCYVDPHRNSYLLEALHQLLDKNAVELVQNPQSLGFYNRLFPVLKPNWWRPILDLSTLNNYLKTQSFKMETPETIRTSLQAGEWVTSIDFKDAYFHIPINSQSRKYMHFHIQGEAYQFKALPFGLSTAPMEFTVVAKEVNFLAMKKGIRIHQYLDDWLVRARSHPTCLQHTNLGSSLSRIGLASERGKIRAGTQTSFQFCRLPVRLERGQGQTHPETLADSTDQNMGNYVQSSVSGPESNVLDRITDCHRKTSIFGPFTYETHTVASQKQLESTRDNRNDHPHSQITPPTSKMVAGGKQCSHRSTITPTKTCAADLYRHIKRRVGRSLKQAHGKGKLPESKLHINYLELKADLLDLKEFQALCTNNTVLIATDNTTVVAYINKEGGMKSGPLCALLWRILPWCTRKQVTLKARHIPGRLNVIADKLSRLRQTIQTE